QPGARGRPPPATGVGGAAAFDARARTAPSGAPNDPEPTVRATGVRSLGQTLAARAVPPITARLVDVVRVVRVRAAEALFTFGIASLDGPAGAALAHAQDEWMESLRTFSDAAADHIVLAQLMSARGSPDAAAKELAIAI